MDSAETKVKPLHLEELMEYQDEIKKSINDSDKILQILHKMELINVNYEDLSESKVGITLKMLTQIKQKEIAEKSHELITKWKKVIRHSRESKKKKEEKNRDSKHINTEQSNIHNHQESSSLIIDNPEHEGWRNSIKKLIYNAFINQLPEGFTAEKAKEITLAIDQTLTEKFKKDKYINRGKAIMSNIQDKKNEEFRKKILSGELTPEKLATMDVRDMANQDLKKERLQVQKDMFNSMRSDWNKEHAPVYEGMYTCGKCKGKRCSTNEIQMRSADEPMTIFVTCNDCGNTWRIG